MRHGILQIHIPKCAMAYCKYTSPPVDAQGIAALGNGGAEGAVEHVLRGREVGQWQGPPAIVKAKQHIAFKG